MKLRMLASLVTLGATLAACTGPGPGITGNDFNGIIPYPLVASQTQPGVSDRMVAAGMAADFCARYNKRGVVTSIHRQYGDYVTFDCRWR